MAMRKLISTRISRKGSKSEKSGGDPKPKKEVLRVTKSRKGSGAQSNSEVPSRNFRASQAQKGAKSSSKNFRKGSNPSSTSGQGQNNLHPQLLKANGNDSVQRSSEMMPLSAVAKVAPSIDNTLSESVLRGLFAGSASSVDLKNSTDGNFLTLQDQLRAKPSLANTMSDSSFKKMGNNDRFSSTEDRQTRDRDDDKDKSRNNRNNKKINGNSNSNGNQMGEGVNISTRFTAKYSDIYGNVDVELNSTPIPHKSKNGEAEPKKSSSATSNATKDKIEDQV